MGAFTCQAAGKAPEVLHYVSPEQLRGDPVDGRSNMFSLGAILYEMVTETKAFAGEDAEQVRQAIHEFTPPAPAEINSKIHPALSEVIMKALAKSPEERYQSGQELVNDLERCKESAPKKEAKKSAAPAKGLNVPQAAKPAAPRCASAKEITVAAPAAHDPASQPTQAKAAAAAAGWESASHSTQESPKPPKEVQASPKAVAQSSLRERASALAEAEEAQVQSPAHGVDPAMAEAAAKEAGTRPQFF